MDREKNKIPAALVTALIMILAFFGMRMAGVYVAEEKDSVKVGLMCVGDESTPYSENMLRVTDILQMEYGSRVSFETRSNVPEENAEQELRELCSLGCQIIFTNSYGYGDAMKRMAAEYPDVQFCQAGCSNANDEPFYRNYHTFMGEISEGWFAAGRIAGLKLQQMVDERLITDSETWLGFVGAYENAETISGYTAFLLGARDVCPSARIKVTYTDTWSNYRLEKAAAEKLINDGCIIISQNSDTIGPAVACEECTREIPVFHVGYNMDMLTVAPNTSLVGTRIDWSPYVLSAVDAVFHNQMIESVCEGNVHGNDVGAGFEHGWVKMLEMNRAISAPGSEDLLDETIEDFENGSQPIFYGKYIGVDPENPDDVCDLTTEFHENTDVSYPTFHYILEDVVVIVK